VSEDELRQALSTVGLDIDLDARVLEGGKDYGVGERQLLIPMLRNEYSNVVESA
jgi:hypothetical protein